ncbi:threonine/serine exporter family protein [Brachybacterium sp. EF45031]|nr:threonine/serine exporter family protein [Brachybacterium sillae]
MPTYPIHEVFTFALRAGSIMARNGSPAANVTHAMLAVARTHGHGNATASVTMDQLTLAEISTDEDRSVTMSQSVGASGFNL